jgi:hypothetical protein
MKTMATALTRRLGTAAAAFLVGKLGIPDDLAHQIVMAGGVLAGLAVDACFAMYFARAK